MRTLFLLLVLANLAFFAWSRYAGPRGAGDPAPLARQIDPEKLRIVAPKDLPPPRPASRPEPPPAASSPAAAAPSPVAAAPSLACLEWGSFTVSEAPRAQKALEPLALGERVVQRRTREIAGWWVFIPSQQTREGAMRKAAELRALGIQEYFILQEPGAYRWALSLGVFRSEEAAKARLAALQARGVRTARVGARDTAVPRVWLQVKSVDPALETRLKDLARQIEGSELRSCSS